MGYDANGVFHDASEREPLRSRSWRCRPDGSPVFAVVGRVERVSGNGVQLWLAQQTTASGSTCAAVGIRWYTVSKFANPRPTLPKVGDTVRLGLDGQEFIREIEPGAAQRIYA